MTLFSYFSNFVLFRSLIKCHWLFLLVFVYVPSYFYKRSNQLKFSSFWIYSNSRFQIFPVQNFSNSFFYKVNQSKCSYSLIFSKGTRGSTSSFLGLYLNYLDLNDLNYLEISNRNLGWTVKNVLALQLGWEGQVKWKRH